MTAKNGSKPSTAPVSRDKGRMYEPSFVCVSNSRTFLTSFFSSGTLDTKYINCLATMLNTILACDLSLAAQNNCRPSFGSLSNKNEYSTRPDTRIDLPCFLAIDMNAFLNLNMSVSFVNQPRTLAIMNFWNNPSLLMLPLGSGNASTNLTTFLARLGL